ncbi:hypothetical protein FOA52_000450 [Chlamydomonas sp. UWO 241]|nr:hypothetical protein FOA52_000450 [Chlamydomonas sp. UWO 241]
MPPRGKRPTPEPPSVEAGTDQKRAKNAPSPPLFPCSSKCDEACQEYRRKTSVYAAAEAPDPEGDHFEAWFFRCLPSQGCFALREGAPKLSKE